MLNTEAVAVEDVTIDGDAPLMLRAVALLNVTVGLAIVVVPLDAPNATAVAAPPILRVVTVELKTEAVVLVVAITGEAPFKFNAVALLNVTVWLAIVAVPVDAPNARVVAAPPIFNVVTVELNREAVVLVVAIAGDAPLMLRAVALANVTVELLTVAVPLAAPRESVVAAPKALTVVAVVFNRSKEELLVVTDVVSCGLVERTTEPVPVIVAKPEYSASQDAALVPEARIHRTLTAVPGKTVTTKLPPEEFTVKLPVLLFSIKY